MRSGIPLVLRRFLSDRAAGWRTGSTGSQALALGVLLVGVACSFAVSVLDYGLMPLTAYLVWLLVGMLLLRLRPLLVLASVTTVAGFTAVLLDGELTSAKIAAAVSLVVAVALVLY